MIHRKVPMIHRKVPMIHRKVPMIQHKVPMIQSKIQKRRRLQKNEIPFDVVEEILTKLPSKSLMRFKCVSKLWSSFINSSYFTNRCLKIPSRHRLYICLQDTSTDSNNVVTLSLASDTSCATPSSCSVVDQDLTIPRLKCFIVQNLCNVFMCYTVDEKPQIYNPTTRQLITLPEAITTKRDKSFCHYFGYDSDTDQYKVVCSTGVFLKNSEHIRSKHWCFVLKDKEKRFWKKLIPNPVSFLPHIPATQGVCIDGVIYYLGWTSRYDPAILISFDIKTEDFRMIQVPWRDEDDPVFHLLLSQKLKNVSLIECNGKVTIIDQTDLKEYGMLYLWSLEDVENKNWCREILVLQPSQQHLVNNNTTYNVKGSTQDGKIFLIPNDFNYPFHILSYDLVSNDLRKITIKGVPFSWFRKNGSIINMTLMDLRESFMYLET